MKKGFKYCECLVANMGTEVWLKPPTEAGIDITGEPRAGYLGWLCNTGDRAFGNWVYVRPPNGMPWYEEVVEKNWWGKVTARYWVIKKETLDATRNAFYNAWNSLDCGDPRSLDAGQKWLVENPDAPGMMSLGLDEATELAALMAGLKDWSGYDHINDLWEMMKAEGLNTLDDTDKLNGE